MLHTRCVCVVFLRGSGAIAYHALLFPLALRKLQTALILQWDRALPSSFVLGSALSL